MSSGRHDSLGTLGTGAATGLGDDLSRGVTRERCVTPQPNEIHSLLGHYARLFWDIQKLRVAVGNRQKAMFRDGLSSDWTVLHDDLLQLLTRQEKAIQSQLTRLVKRHIMADWIQECPGLGFPSFAGIVGVTGSFENFPTVSKVWHYLGLHVENGSAPKRTRGVRLTYSPQGRVICYRIGDSIVRLNRGRYRKAYDSKKAYYEEARPDWPQVRRHRAAMRYAVKALIKDMWVEWRRRAFLGLESNTRMPANAPLQAVPL